MWTSVRANCQPRACGVTKKGKNVEKVSISTALMNSIVQYLANRPYIEVAGLIEKIQQELKEPKDGGKVDTEGNQ